VTGRRVSTRTVLSPVSHFPPDTFFSSRTKDSMISRSVWPRTSARAERSLQAIYKIESSEQEVFVAQQLDVFIESTSGRTKR